MAATLDQLLDARYSRRERGYDRYLDRQVRREAEADSQIGELIRDGQTVFYIWPIGGKYREGTRSELVAFLLRNRYA